MTAPDRPDSGERTLHDYSLYVSAFQKWINKNCPDAVFLRDITADNAAMYAASIIKAGKSAGTYNKHTGFLKLLFSILAEAARIEKNPFEKIARKKKNTQSRRELTIQELITILDSATGDLYSLLLLGATTGLRLGDCCTLKWSDIDLARQIIRRVPNKTARRETSKPVTIGIPEKLHNALSLEPDKVGYVLSDMARRYTKSSLPRWHNKTD